MTKKFIIKYGVTSDRIHTDVIEALDVADAENTAYEAARADFEDTCYVSAVEYTEELANKLGVCD